MCLSSLGTGHPPAFTLSPTACVFRLTTHKNLPFYFILQLPFLRGCLYMPKPFVNKLGFRRLTYLPNLTDSDSNRSVE